MYVNKGDDKVRQLHSDIGKTMPRENLKLGQGMTKKYGYMGGGKVYGQPRKASYKGG